MPLSPPTSTIQAPDLIPLQPTTPTPPEENLRDQPLEDTLDMRKFRELVLSESTEAIEDANNERLAAEETTKTTEEATTETTTEEATTEKDATEEILPTTSVATRSGRIPKAVIGNRLIDQI